MFISPLFLNRMLPTIQEEVEPLNDDDPFKIEMFLFFNNAINTFKNLGPYSLGLRSDCIATAQNGLAILEAIKTKDDKEGDLGSSVNYLKNRCVTLLHQSH